MSKLFDRLSAKLSLFWRYFFLLAAVVLLFLAAFTLATRQFTAALQDTYLEQTRENFEQNCVSFSKELFLPFSIPAAVESCGYYSSVSSVQQPFSARTTYAFTQVRTSFLSQCAMLNLPSEYFLYFRTSNVCFVHSRFFSDTDACFGSYLVYDQPDAVLPLLKTGGRADLLRLLPAQSVSLAGGAPTPCLTLLVNSTYNDAVYGFLYSEQVLLDFFHLSALPDDTCFQLLDADGTPLYSHGQSAPDAALCTLSCTIPSLSCTAVLGIPQSYFQDTVRSVRDSFVTIFLCAVVIGLLMCFLFSHLSVKPFRRLIQAHSMSRTDGAQENELAAIDSFLKNTREKNDALRSMLLSSLLVRSFSGQPIREDEYQTLSLTFPLFQDPLRIALVRDRSLSASPEDRASLFNLLQEALPEPFLCEYISIQESVVLFSADPAEYDQLQRTLGRLNGSPEQEPRFVCGVSAPFIGLGELSGAIRQAQFCVPEDGDRVLIPFSEDAVSAAPSPAPTSFDLKQFQQALATWNQAEMLGMIERFSIQASKRGAAHPEEVFYSILFLLRDAAQTGRMSFAPYEKTAYLHTSTPADNLHQLCTIINDLFEQKAALQLSDKQQAAQALVQYIKTHFSDPSLCLFSLARQFCVSERFAHNAIQSATGMNFSSLLSLTRMQEAARLLRETEESIPAVAERCGYPAISTFYRNFKKHYSVTPAEYKDSAQRDEA